MSSPGTIHPTDVQVNSSLVCSSANKQMGGSARLTSRHPDSNAYFSLPPLWRGLEVWLIMSPKQKTLALREELRIIQVFDRVHDYAAEADPANERAYAVRQARRRQIIDEIANLRVSKSVHGQPRWLSATLSLLCAIGLAMLCYVLR